MQNGGPEVLQYGEQPDPVAYEGQVVVDIHAASVNGADWKTRSGYHAPTKKFPHIPGRDFSGRVLRIFEVGHVLEDLAIRWFRLIGFDLYTRKAHGGQFGFSVADGRLQGHIDGVIVGGPEGFAYPALWECKCLGNKSWSDLDKKGLTLSKPVYAAQVAIYQAYLELHEHPAIFTAINADTMEIYTELVPFDAALAQRMSDRAVKVITATEAGELLPRAFNDPTHFECRMCAYANRCWSLGQ